jgi:hypothetical protein
MFTPLHCIVFFDLTREKASVVYVAVLFTQCRAFLATFLLSSRRGSCSVMQPWFQNTGIRHADPHQSYITETETALPKVVHWSKSGIFSSLLYCHHRYTVYLLERIP